jgi:pyruvate/2-oxoglutarate/acetoin dehydrogenase E1 component
VKGAVPDGDDVVPIGEATVRREGGNATLVSYGAMMLPSLEAADRLAKEGVEVEVIDLRTLSPFDRHTIFGSLDKTNRMLIVQEDVRTLGIASEISAVVMDEKFASLDAPVMRVTYPDTHSPFSHVLEAANLPNVDTIAAALRTLVAY